VIARVRRRRAGCLLVVGVLAAAWLLPTPSLVLVDPSQAVAAFAAAAKSAASAGVRRHHDAPPPVLPGTRRRVLHWTVDGVVRRVVEVAPAGQSGPLPLLVVLHGRRQTPWRAEATQQWDALAAAGRAVIAYGAGFAGSWNAGMCCGPAERRKLDDVGYVLRVLRLEQSRHRIDPHRIFLVGFSNGGMLAYRFACVHADVISAVAIVGGAVEVPVCRPSRPLDVLDIEGDRDLTVPFGGSRYSPVAGAPTRSIPDSLRPWLAIRRAGEVVRLVRLPGVGHEWPTLRRGGWDATGAVWRFLLASASAPRAQAVR
jgi:polyhydroxybutyrate depolymerase